MHVVTVLTKSNCDNCVRARDILHRLSTELGFTVELIDIETATGSCLAREHGVMFAPGVLVDGRLSTYGRPSERRLRRDIEASIVARRP